jgi:DHA1 family tetracycline resistance protein-like MFS transporter
MFSKRKAALGFIFVTLLIDVIGWGIVIPVIPELFHQLGGLSDTEGSAISAWLVAAFGVMQFLFSPIMGNLSDQYGRRPVLLLSLFGFGLDYLFLVFAPSILWLFVGRIIAGIMGASFTTAAAYIADISEPEKRAQNFGLIGAAFGLGFIIGPALGGLVAGYGLRAPFIAAAVLTLLNWLYGYFILPESLPLDRRRKFEWRRANPVGSLEFFLRHKVILGLTSAILLIYIAAHAVQTTWGFYTRTRFGWEAKEIGLSLAVVGLLVALVQGLLIRIVIPRLGPVRSIYVGLFLYSVGFLLFGLATKGWMMYAFLIPYCMGGIAGPALQGIMSNQVDPREQGALQGALTGLMSLTTIFGPLLMSGIFYFTADPDSSLFIPGAVMFSASTLMLISAMIARVSLKKNHA